MFVIVLTGSDEKVWIATAVLTLLVIIFGETMPKIISKKNANSIALRNAWAIRFLTIVFKPLIWVVVNLIRLLTIGLKESEPADSSEEAVEELQSIIETAEDEEVLDEEQKELLQAAIDFSERSVFEVMTARVDV